MGLAARCCVLLCVLCACCSWGSRGQELREQDAVCRQEGCFAIYFQRKTFVDAWRSCKDRGGNLATVKRPEEAALVQELFSMAYPHGSASQLHFWIGLQRQPRQCAPTRPLRGFTWITGDQDTQYTNWLRDDQTSTCSAPRCVVMSYGGSADDFKWLDGSCTVAVDGFLCRYNYKGMCPAILDEGGGIPFYATPFNLVSSLLAFVPFGSVATVPCPDGIKGDQSVLCMVKEDGSVGWSKEAPLCSEEAAQNWCDQDNGGCEHLCLTTDGHYYCECSPGFVLAEDGQSCWSEDACRGSPCEFECQPSADGYRCSCPQGYLLAPNGQDCQDVDECLQDPCPYGCVNAPGTFQCLCGEGYEPIGPNGECEDEDECLHEPCEHACENTPGSYACHCHLGYSPMPDDPTSCQDTDECRIPGTCQQMCVNYEGGFECHCEEGYELQPDHSSCEPIDENAPTFAPLYRGVTGFFNSWAEGGHRFSWQLPDWMTEPPRLAWFPRGKDWFTEAPGEELDSSPLPDWVPDNPVHDWADPYWRERFKPALTSAPRTDTEYRRINREITPMPVPDWTEEEVTTFPAFDLIEEKTSPTPEPDWMERETSSTAEPDWMKAETTSTPASNWKEEETTPTSLPEWPETKTAPIPPPPHHFDVKKDKSQSSPSISLGGGAVGEGLGPSPSLPAPQEGRGAVRSTVSQGLGPDGASDIEFGLQVSSDSLLDSRGKALDASNPERVGTGQEARVPAPEWYTPALPTLTTISDGRVDPEDGGVELEKDLQREDKSWLVVALLVPLCIFVVVMVALGIVYCTRCAVQTRSKSAADCYRWITSSKPATDAATKSRV